MNEVVTPMNQIMHRVVEHGRIRFGIKGPKGEPKQLRVFRFTSTDRTAIEQLAVLYGGEPVNWRDRGEHEVITKASEIDVILPPHPLGDGPVYELWTAGGLVRRCDGETAVAPTASRDGADMVELPCVCRRNGALACKPVTRLNVIIPNINFGGAWRLEAKGWNVAQEMPGMVELIEAMQERIGLTRAILALEVRQKKVAGRTRKYVIPVLRVGFSPDQLALGAGGGVVALPPATPQGEAEREGVRHQEAWVPR